MTILILEGSDAVGKTTLAEELHKITGFEVVKGSSFEISELGADGMYKHMMDLLDEKNIIIDRMSWSNYVYSSLYDYPRMSDAQFLDIASKAEKKALTVYLTANADLIKMRLKKRGDDYVKADRIDDILAKYQEALVSPLTSQSVVLHLDNSFIDTKHSAPMIVEFAEMQERKTYMNKQLRY